MKARLSDTVDHLDDPVRDRERQERQRIGQRREQRAVRAVQVAPGGEAVDRVVHLLADHVRVRVQVVQRAEPRVAEVVEQVGELQRRAEQQDQLHGDDATDDRAHRQRAAAPPAPPRRRQHREDQPAEPKFVRGRPDLSRAEQVVQRARLPAREDLARARDQDRTGRRRRTATIASAQNAIAASAVRPAVGPSSTSGHRSERSARGTRNGANRGSATAASPGAAVAAAGAGTAERTGARGEHRRTVEGAWLLSHELGNTALWDAPTRGAGRVAIWLSAEVGCADVTGRGSVGAHVAPNITARERRHGGTRPVARGAPAARPDPRAARRSGDPRRRRADRARRGAALLPARPPGVLVRRGQHRAARALLARARCSG